MKNLSSELISFFFVEETPLTKAITDVLIAVHKFTFLQKQRECC